MFPFGDRWRESRRIRLTPHLVSVVIVVLLFGHDLLMATPLSAASVGVDSAPAMAGRVSAARDRHGDHQTTPHPANCGIGQIWAPAPSGAVLTLTPALFDVWARSSRPAPQIIASEPPPRPPQVARALLQIFRL